MSLFKFQSLDTHSVEKINSLLKGEFHTSLLSELNDPFEGIYYQHESLYFAQKKEFDERINRRRIYSLSSPKSDTFVYSEMLMWSHYAGGHRGYCLEFDESFLTNSSTPLVKSTTSSNKSLVANFYREVTYNNDLPDVHSNITDADLNFVLTHKTESWSYEEELRLVFHSADQQINRPIPEGSLRRIYLGVYMPDIHRELLKKIANVINVECIELKLDINNRCLIAK